jgi:hypothetical protein
MTWLADSEFSFEPIRISGCQAIGASGYTFIRGRNHVKDPWAHALDNPLDDTALAGRVPALEHHDDALAGLADPPQRCNPQRSSWSFSSAF